MLNEIMNQEEKHKEEDVRKTLYLSPAADAMLTELCEIAGVRHSAFIERIIFTLYKELD